MKIVGQPGNWFVFDEKTGEQSGPFTTRAEVKAHIQSTKTVRQPLLRLVVQRDDNGRISEVLVVPGESPITAVSSIDDDEEDD